MLICRVALAADSSMWMMALGKSAVATAVCVAVLGVPFLPKEMARRRTERTIRAVYCAAMPDGKSIISLTATPGNKRKTQQILVYDLSQDSLSIKPLLPNANPVCAVLDPIGSRVFVGDVNGALISTDPQYNSNHESVLGHVLRGRPESIACSQDGQTLMVGDGRCLYAWDIGSQEGHDVPRWCRVEPSLACFAITPDSRSVICAKTSGSNSDLIEIDICTGETRRVIAKVDQQLSKLTMSDDGEFLAGVGETGRLILLRYDSDHGSWRTYVIPSLCSGTTLVACFSRTGRLLITSNGDSTRLIAWDLDRGEILREFDPLEGALLGCTFLNDEQLLSWSRDGKLQIWDVRNPLPVREITL